MEDYIVKKHPKCSHTFSNINKDKKWKPVISAGLIKCSHCKKVIRESDDAILPRDWDGFYSTKLDLETGECNTKMLHRSCALYRYDNPSKPDHLPDPNSDCETCVADFYEEIWMGHAHIIFNMLKQINDTGRKQKEIKKMQDGLTKISEG